MIRRWLVQFTLAKGRDGDLYPIGPIRPDAFDREHGLWKRSSPPEWA